MARLSASDLKLWQAVTNGVRPIVTDQIAPCASSRPKGRPVAPPKWSLDLHGLTVHQAFLRTSAFLEDAHFANVKSVTIITGLSGQIRQEFPRWCEQLPYIGSVKIERSGGSFRIRIK